MWETSARLLQLLSLLQVRREWTGPELSARLEVSERTVRRDIDRLRALGYPVDATRGSVGGYRLASGADLPPLLLDDEEAVAIAVGLRTAARSPVTGIEEASARALVKLEQVMPARLRGRVSAVAASVVAIPPDAPAPAVDADLVAGLSLAVRDHEVLRFDYVAHGGEETMRRVEPVRLVVWGRRWYLVAWDLGRADWRTFRVDRIGHLWSPSGPRFTPRELPEDPVVWVARTVSAAGFRVRARLLVHAPASVVSQKISPAVGVVEAVDTDSCVLVTGADHLETIAVYVGFLDADFEVLEPPELTAQVRELAERYVRAAGHG
ncbi:MAG: YafY family protein [Propionicimonas sp.]|uniref:helix-turn-helix transcriptional regulator n=1 Tax=Propionicimonas sp. TaxID=1955623 RepID=UPI002B20D96B|nr:YafY family protein [Propionicimonas sp.]MEA4945382.1 YafY family protein [Propionicimonas sp.]